MLLPPSLLPGLNVKWAVAILVAVAIGLTAYSHGRHVRNGELAQVERDTALAYAAGIVERQHTADALAAQNSALLSAQASKDKIITKEIVKYEFITPPRLRCTLPGAFRLLHDAAATGNPTAPQAGALDAASADPIEDAPLLETIGHNYTACRRAIAQVEAWQRRYHALEASEATP